MVYTSLFSLQAYNGLEEMRNKIPKVNVTFYVNIKTIQQIHKALDVPMKDQDTNGVRIGGGGADEDEGEEVEEDVVDET